jgi:hypothetical protein
LSTLKKLVFADLQCKVALERGIQRGVIKKVMEIEECDDKDVVNHQKVVILVLNNNVLIRLAILDVVVMRLNTMFSYLTELVGS